MDTISLVLIFTVINSFMISFTLGFVLSKVSKPDKNNSGTSDNPDRAAQPVLTDEQLKVFYEADKKQTEAFNATLQSLHNFMTGEETEEVKKQND